MARSDSRERMLDAAATLLQRQGYAATGMNDIVRASGTPKGSLYFHFPGGKEQLALEAIERSGARWRAVIDEELARADGPADAIRLVCARLAADLEASDFADGCPVATVALETDSAPLRDACRASFADWLTRIASELEAGGVDAEAAEKLSVFVLASIEGALLLARAQRDTAPLKIVGEMLGGLAGAAA